MSKHRVSEVVPQPGLAWRVPTACKGPAVGGTDPETWGRSLLPRTSRALSQSGGKEREQEEEGEGEIRGPRPPVPSEVMNVPKEVMEKVGRVALTEQVTFELRLVLSESESCTSLEEEASGRGDKLCTARVLGLETVCWSAVGGQNLAWKQQRVVVGAELIAIAESHMVACSWWEGPSRLGFDYLII